MRPIACVLSCALLLALAPVAEAWPERYRLHGSEGETELSGELRLSSDEQGTRGRIQVQAGAEHLDLQGSLTTRGKTLSGSFRISQGLAGELQQSAGAPAPGESWLVTITPQGLRAELKLQRGLRRTARGLRRTPGVARRDLVLSGQGELGPASADNAAAIHRFYSAFARKDAAAMEAEYAADVHFSDPVFPNLHGSDAGAMWAMLCQSEDLTLTFSGIEAGERYGVAHWEAHYSLFGNAIHNVIDASFEFREGKIVRHVDSFSFKRWARQALPYLRWLPSSFVNRAVSHLSARQLKSFIAERAEAAKAR